MNMDGIKIYRTENKLKRLHGWNREIRRKGPNEVLKLPHITGIQEEKTFIKTGVHLGGKGKLGKTGKWILWDKQLQEKRVHSYVWDEPYTLKVNVGCGSMRIMNGRGKCRVNTYYQFDNWSSEYHYHA